MKLFRAWFGPTLLIVVSLAACNPAAPSPAQLPTATVVSLLTQPEASPSAQIEPVRATTSEPVIAATTAPPSPPPTTLPTLPPKPTATPTPVPTFTPNPSPTPEPEPMVTIPQTSTITINVRSGPGTDYPVLDQFKPGQNAPVTGRNADQSWWQVNLADNTAGWIFGQLVQLSGNTQAIPLAQAPPPPPTVTPAPQAETSAQAEANDNDDAPKTPEELEGQLRCGKDFCITYQAMLTIGENGGCIGNHSIYITVLQGPPPGTPMSGVVIGDTFNNVEVASGDKGPGMAEITLWSNTMSVKAKRNVDGTPYTSEESYAFTSADELIPAEILAANGYCDGNVERCRWAHENNQVCRGHYSYRVTFHKFD